MKRAWAALSAVVLVAGCSSVTFSNQGLEAIQRELQRRYDLWKTQAITAYEYRFARECPCASDLTRPVLVSVADTVVLAVIYADSGTAVPASAFSSYFTVEGLFGQAQIGINLLADSLVIEYDPLLHYPTKVVIDQDRRRVNDELALFASDLKKK